MRCFSTQCDFLWSFVLYALCTRIEKLWQKLFQWINNNNKNPLFYFSVLSSVQHQFCKADLCVYSVPKFLRKSAYSYLKQLGTIVVADFITVRCHPKTTLAILNRYISGWGNKWFKASYHGAKNIEMQNFTFSNFPVSN